MVKTDQAYGTVSTYTCYHSKAPAIRATFFYEGSEVATLSPPPPKDGNMIEQINFLKNAVDEYTRGGTIGFASPFPSLYEGPAFGIIDEVARIMQNISTAKAA
jgi:hypothetical protein